VAPIGLEAIIAPLVLCIEKDEHTAGEADAEPGNIDDGNELVPPKIADGDGKVVSEHTSEIKVES
jgi:hypothetical protein